MKNKITFLVLWVLIILIAICARIFSGSCGEKVELTSVPYQIIDNEVWVRNQYGTFKIKERLWDLYCQTPFDSIQLNKPITINTWYVDFFDSATDKITQRNIVKLYGDRYSSLDANPSNEYNFCGIALVIFVCILFSIIVESVILLQITITKHCKHKIHLFK